MMPQGRTQKVQNNGIMAEAQIHGTAKAIREISDMEKATEMREAGVSERGLPASKRYKVNPLYSRTPIAICENTLIGLPVCSKGEGKFCYCKSICGAQTKLDGSGEVIDEAKAKADEDMKKALKHSRDVMDEQLKMNFIGYEEYFDFLVHAVEGR